MNPFNGDWLARTRMEVQNFKHVFKERGICYNHSSYNDIIITGLVGLRPSLDNNLTINPMIPDDWDYFCLDDVLYKGKRITILWDKAGEKYQKGKGFRVFVDGRQVVKAPQLQKVQVKLK